MCCKVPQRDVWARLRKGLLANINLYFMLKSHKTEPGSNVNQIITVSSLQMFLITALFCVTVL